jgi:hypothetical protein
LNDLEIPVPMTLLLFRCLNYAPLEVVVRVLGCEEISSQYLGFFEDSAVNINAFAPSNLAVPFTA